MRTDRKRIAKLAAIYLVATAAGWLCQRIGIPLPWMIGPLLSTAVLVFSGAVEVVVPVQTRPFGQGIIASQVGLYFSPAVFSRLLETGPLLVGMAVVTICTGFLVALVLSRLAGIRYASALVSTLPTSPVEASVMAERYGFPLAPVILSQTLRAASVVVLIPIAIYAVHGAPDRSFMPSTNAFDPLGNVMLAALAAAGMLVFLRLGVPNPYFLGPLAFASALTAAGVQLAAFPAVIFAGAQVVLGTWLGATFRRSLFTSAGRMVLASVACTMLFILLAAIAAVLIAPFVGMEGNTLVLATAPGGVTEMALTAKFLGADVALITAFHITRIFIITPSIPLMVDLLHRLRDRRPRE